MLWVKKNGFNLMSFNVRFEKKSVNDKSLEKNTQHANPNGKSKLILILIMLQVSFTFHKFYI